MSIVVAVLFPWHPSEKVIGIHCCTAHDPIVHSGLGMTDGRPITAPPCGGLLINELNDGTAVSCTIRCEKCTMTMTSSLTPMEFDSLRAKHTLQLLGERSAISEEWSSTPASFDLRGPVYTGRAFYFRDWARTRTPLAVPYQLIRSPEELIPSVNNFISAIMAINASQLRTLKSKLVDMVEAQQNSLDWLSY